MPTVIDGITGINRITGGADVGGNLDFVGSGPRITSDSFSSQPPSTRFAFQTSQPNLGTIVAAIPNGTGNASYIRAMNNSDANNTSYVEILCSTSGAILGSGSEGAGIFLPLLFANSGLERMRLTANGDLWINNTFDAAPGVGNTNTGAAFERANDGTTLFLSRAAFPELYLNRNSDGLVALFNRSGNNVGSIAVTTTNAAYNTISDYRLKENIRAMVAPLERLLRLKPVLFNWKVDGSEGEGFIAHQLQQEVPIAVSGEKDGKEMQGVDASKVVPLLVAAVQELTLKVLALEARLS